MNPLGVELTPHPAKVVFDKYDVELWAVAKRVNLNMNYVRDILNGRFKATEEVNQKLTKCVKEIEDYYENKNQ